MILVQKQFAGSNKSARSKKKRSPESGKETPRSESKQTSNRKAAKNSRKVSATQPSEVAASPTVSNPAPAQRTPSIPIEERIAEANRNSAAASSPRVNSGASESVMSKNAAKSKGGGLFSRLKSSLSKAKDSVSGIFKRGKSAPASAASNAGGNVMSSLGNRAKASVISSMIDKGAAINPRNNSTKLSTPSAIESTVLGKSSAANLGGKVPGSTLSLKEAIAKKDIMSSYIPASSAESYQAALGSTGSSSYRLVKPGTGQTKGIRGVGRNANLNGATFNPKNMPGYVESSPGMGKTNGIRGVGRGSRNLNGATFDPMNIQNYAENHKTPGMGKTNGIRGVGRGSRNLNGATFDPMNIQNYAENHKTPGMGKTNGIRGVGRDINRARLKFNPKNMPGYVEPAAPVVEAPKTGSVMETPKTPVVETPKTPVVETPKTGSVMETPKTTPVAETTKTPPAETTTKTPATEATKTPPAETTNTQGKSKGNSSGKGNSGKGKGSGNSGGGNSGKGSGNARGNTPRGNNGAGRGATPRGSRGSAAAGKIAKKGMSGKTKAALIGSGILGAGALIHHSMNKKNSNS